MSNNISIQVMNSKCYINSKFYYNPKHRNNFQHFNNLINNFQHFDTLDDKSQGFNTWKKFIIINNTLGRYSYSLEPINSEQFNKIRRLSFIETDYKFIADEGCDRFCICALIRACYRENCCDCQGMISWADFDGIKLPPRCLDPFELKNEPKENFIVPMYQYVWDNPTDTTNIIKFNAFMSKLRAQTLLIPSA